MTGSLNHPAPAAQPILTTVYLAGEPVAMLTRAPGSSSATLRDAQGRLRTVIDSEDPARESMRYIENHREDFQPQREDSVCHVNAPDPNEP